MSPPLANEGDERALRACFGFLVGRERLLALHGQLSDDQKDIVQQNLGPNHSAVAVLRKMAVPVM